VETNQGGRFCIRNSYLYYQNTTIYMTTIYNVYDQLSQILARLHAAEIQKLKATHQLQTRFDVLSEKAVAGDLPIDEKDELDHYVVLERLIRLAKIKAIQA
jgi:hypothetical protein